MRATGIPSTWAVKRCIFPGEPTAVQQMESLKLRHLSPKSRPHSQGSRWPNSFIFFKKLALLTYDWHTIICAYLKHTICWVLTYVYTCRTPIPTKRVIIHHPQCLLMLTGNPPSGHSKPPSPLIFLLLHMSLHFLEFYVNRIMQCTLIFVWLLSLSIIRFWDSSM